MTIRSMTGFGSGSARVGNVTWQVDLKSVNHKYCDVTIKLPVRLAFMEQALTKAIRDRLPRGRIDVSIQRTDAHPPQTLQLNESLLTQVLGLVSRLRAEFGVVDQIAIGDLLGIRDLVVVRDEEGNLQDDEQALRLAVTQALDELCRMRLQEGAFLEADFLNGCARIEKRCGLIEGQARLSLIDHQRSLRERIAELLGGNEGDPNRLHQEVAYLVDRSDITEEISRIHSHLKQFKTFMQSVDPIGRKLDFLLQELHREANTIGSKANDATISHGVVEIKAELEKLREQAQNIE